MKRQIIGNLALSFILSTAIFSCASYQRISKRITTCDYKNKNLWNHEIMIFNKDPKLTYLEKGYTCYIPEKGLVQFIEHYNITNFYCPYLVFADFNFNRTLDMEDIILKPNKSK